MKTLLFEYLRDTVSPFWETYVARQSVPKAYHAQTLRLLGGNASSFIHFIIRLQLYGPLYKPFNIPSEKIHNTFYCFKIQNNKIKIVYKKAAQQNPFLPSIFKKIQDHYLNWSKDTSSYTSFQHLLDLKNNHVMGILGCYIYDSESAIHHVFVYNLDFPETYCYNRQLEYYRLSKQKKYELSYKEKANSQQNNIEIIKGNYSTLKITNDDIQSLLRSFPKKKIIQYRTHTKLLNGLHLRIFSDLKSEEIAHFIGYKSSNSFFVAFKNNFGMSPGDVQKQINIL